MTLKEHEKFYAFLVLGFDALLLVALAVLFPPEKDQVIRIIDSALGGFLLALGSAANALFRVGTPSEEEERRRRTEIVGAAIDKLPTSPQPVTIHQPADEPIPVSETMPLEESKP